MELGTDVPDAFVVVLGGASSIFLIWCFMASQTSPPKRTPPEIRV